MRYSASEKLEIIRLVEQSYLPVRRTLEQIGISRARFYRWYDLYRRFGEQGLEDRRSGPKRAWNRIPDDVRGQILDMALERPELSPRELAVTFTDERAYFVSETEPPPMNWSTLEYGKRRTGDGQEGSQARRDCCEAAAG
jgi:putative transposase